MAKYGMLALFAISLGRPGLIPQWALWDTFDNPHKRVWGRDE